MNVRFICTGFNDFQPASNLGPLSARQRNVLRMAFRWRADSGPILCAYWVVHSGAAGNLNTYKPAHGDFNTNRICVKSMMHHFNISAI